MIPGKFLFSSVMLLGSTVAVDQPAMIGSVRQYSNQQVTVTMKSMKFLPETLEVQSGTLVTWENTDVIVHTVTSGRYPKSDRKFDSKILVPKKSFSYRFTEPGTYEYFCQPHASMGMKGVVIVK